MAKNGVAYGIILGAVVFAVTGDAYWIAIGVAIGAGIATTAARKLPQDGAEPTSDEES